MAPRYPALSVSLTEEERLLMERACDLRGMNKMPWAREVIIVAARKEIEAADRAQTEKI